MLICKPALVNCCEEEEEMLKRLVNELRCTLAITTTGPVLVKSGHASVTGPDMTPVRTYRNNEWQVYLPGSSLKGVIRSHLEKICRTLRPGFVCNPFLKPTQKDTVKVQGDHLICPEFADVACSDKFELREKGDLRINQQQWRRPKERELRSPQVYSDSCPICRLFGSTSFIGRFSIGDAYLTNPGPGRVETRDGVGIDRFTGGAAYGAKFELEAVSSGVTFQTEILMRNFECWQVGMLMVAIADLRDELVRVGSGRSRGLGAVKGELNELTIHTVAPTPGRAADEIWGLGKFHSPEERQIYGTFADDLLTIANAPVETVHGLRHVLSLTGGQLRALETAAQTEFVERVDTWPVSTGMQWHNDWQRG
jgi:CRISPR-associated RAMP protein (TIGR02581 family)